jgi:hypothetical protein
VEVDVGVEDDFVVRVDKDDNVGGQSGAIDDDDGRGGGGG